MDVRKVGQELAPVVARFILEPRLLFPLVRLTVHHKLGAHEDIFHLQSQDLSFVGLPSISEGSFGNLMLLIELVLAKGR